MAHEPTDRPGRAGARMAAMTKLVERGDDVRALVRARSPVDTLDGLDVEFVRGDILDRRSVRRAMRGVDRVFHVAGLMGLRGSAVVDVTVNVQGSRVVLEEALRAGVERAVHTSSVAAVGPARRGSTADENQVFDAARYHLPYVDAKREAEAVALRLAAQGLPVVIVNPAHTFGTGELLADERGRVGERYILGNRNFTLDRLFADLGRLSGVEPPAIKLPLPAALAFARAAEAAPGTAVITQAEVRLASLWWAFRSTKAKRELGWRPSHHEDTLQATIDWYREREPLRLERPGTRQPILLRAAGLGVRTTTGLVGRLTP